MYSSHVKPDNQSLMAPLVILCIWSYHWWLLWSCSVWGVSVGWLFILVVMIVGTLMDTWASSITFFYCIIPKLQYLFTSKGLNPMDAMLLTWTLCSCLILHSCNEFFLKEQSEVRFSAIRWATTLYDTQHCPSRYICMTGASDVKLDIRLVTKDLSWHDTFLHLYYKGHPS